MKTFCHILITAVLATLASSAQAEKTALVGGRLIDGLPGAPEEERRNPATSRYYEEAEGRRGNLVTIWSALEQATLQLYEIASLRSQ